MLYSIVHDKLSLLL